MRIARSGIEKLDRESPKSRIARISNCEEYLYTQVFFGIESFVTTSDLEDPFYLTKKMTLRTLNANTVENVFDSLMLEDQINGMVFLLSIVKVENII